MKKTVLGIKIDDVSLDEAAEKVIGWIKRRESRGVSSGKHYIVTPNPEIIMMAQKDSKLKEALNKADLAIPDGVGLKLTTDIVCYTPGVDLMEELINRSRDYGFTVGLLGGAKGVAEKAADCLRKKYPGVRIVYSDSGGVIDINGEWVEGNRKAFSPIDILFVAFGPPKQEKWVVNNLKDIPVKVAMVVGGGLDYLSGKVLRAPKFIRVMGFEWLFRLMMQPWRIKRQLALIKYLLMVR